MQQEKRTDAKAGQNWWFWYWWLLSI